MRNIFTVNATQIVVSESHPEGIKSNVTGYPVDFDSRTWGTEANPNGSEEIALISAQAEYWKEVRDLRIANNANRVGWVVSITRQSDGKELFRYPYGAFPDMTPPAPEPEQEVEQGEGE